MTEMDLCNMSEKSKEFRKWARKHHLALKLPGLTNGKLKDGESEDVEETKDDTKMVDFSSMLLCPLCHEVFSHPVKLPCNHSMCYGCARSQVLNGTNEVESCGADDISTSTFDTVSSLDVTSTTIPDEVVIKTNDLKHFKVTEIKSPTNSPRASATLPPTVARERGGAKSGIRPPSVVTSLRRENSGIPLVASKSATKPKKVKKTEDTRQKRKKQNEALKKIRFLFCPVCITEVELPKSGFQGLVRNVGLERVVARFTNEAKTAVEVKCNYCNPPPKAATKTCLECQMCYCNECFKDFHIWGTKRAMHQTAGPKAKLTKPKVLVCQDHHNKKVTLYCEDCRRPICTTCKLNAKREHNGHTIVQMELAREKAKCRLDANLSDLQGKRQMVIENIENAVEKYSKLEENYNNARTNVNLRLTAMEYHVKKRRDQLIARVEERRKAKETILKEAVEKYHQILERSKILEFTEEAMKEQQADFFLQNLPFIEDGLKRATQELYNFDYEKEYNDDITDFDTNWTEEMAILQRFAQGDIPDDEMTHLKKMLEGDQNNQSEKNHHTGASAAEILKNPDGIVMVNGSLDDVSFPMDGTLSGAESLIATDLDSLLAAGNNRPNGTTVGSLASSMEDLQIVNGRDHSVATDGTKSFICSTPMAANENNWGKIVEHFSNEANANALQTVQRSCTIATQTEEVLLENISPDQYEKARVLESDSTLCNSVHASNITRKIDTASAGTEATTLKHPHSEIEINPKIVKNHNGSEVIVGQAYIPDYTIVQGGSGEVQCEQKQTPSNNADSQHQHSTCLEGQQSNQQTTTEHLTFQSQTISKQGTGDEDFDNSVNSPFQHEMTRQRNVMDQQQGGLVHIQQQQQRGFETQANFEEGNQLERSDIYIHHNLSGNNPDFANQKAQDPSEAKAGVGEMRELWELVQKQNCEVETQNSVVQVRTIDPDVQSSALIKGNRQFKNDGSYKWKIDICSYGGQYVIVGVSDQLQDHSNSSLTSSNPPSPPLHGMQIEGLGIVCGDEGIDPQGFRGTCLLRVIGGEVKLCESWNDLYDPTYSHREDTIITGIGIQRVTIEIQLDVDQQGEHNTVCLYDVTKYRDDSSRRCPIYSKSLRSNNHSEEEGVCFTPVLFCAGDVDFY